MQYHGSVHYYCPVIEITIHPGGRNMASVACCLGVKKLPSVLILHVNWFDNSAKEMSNDIEGMKNQTPICQSTQRLNIPRELQTNFPHYLHQ